MSFWIYADEKPQETHFYYFTKTFEAKSGDEMKANVCADTRYRLFLNDKLICEGPCQGAESTKHYESADLSSYLVDGENKITVKVMYVKEGFFTTTYRRSRPALWFDGRLVSNGETKIISSDESWECLRDDSVDFQHAPGLHGSMPPFEIWQSEKKYTPVKLCKWYEPNISNKCVSVWGIVDLYPLSPRPIPQMKEHEKRAMTEVKRGNGFVIYDTGEYTTAKFYLSLHAPRNTEIRITYAECCSFKEPNLSIALGKKVRDAISDPDSRIDGAKDVIFASGEEQLFSPFWYRAFRYVKIEYPEDAELHIDTPLFAPYFYPFDEAGSFVCSDESYNKMWHVSRNTLLCCTHEMYIDCPYYEQAQYVMDSTLEMLYTFRLSSDTKMPLKSLSDLARSQTADGMICANYPSSRIQVIPGFTLFWIMMVREYLRYTGDVENAKSFIGNIDKALEAFESYMTEEGLIGPTPYWAFVDWVPSWMRGVPSGGNTDPLTVTNLMYAAALRSAYEICEASGKKTRAAEYLSRANAMVERVNSLCYDDEAGLYRDTPVSRNFSQHTTVWAILSGAVTGEDAGALVDRTFSSELKVEKCTFSMNYYFFRALELADRYNFAPALFEGWQKMLDLHCTTWCENPDSPRSECHAWSAAPAYEFSAMALGVYPTSDGYNSLRIRPNVNDLGLTSAKGTVPTKNGIVSVDWRIDNGSFSMTVALPDGADMTAEVCLPDGSKLQMTQNTQSFTCKL